MLGSNLVAGSLRFSYVDNLLRVSTLYCVIAKRYPLGQTYLLCCVIGGTRG